MGYKSNVLLFDPTHGTNRWGFKLCCFVTVATTGRTSILAICLLKEEKRILFEWAFRCFAKAFKVAPGLFVTDSDGEILAAVELVSGPDDVWSGVVHNLCVYHISKNVFKHLRHLFATTSAWRKVFDMFWRIAKQSDISSIDTFDDEWDTFVQLIDDEAKDSDRKDHEIAWVKDLLYKKRKAWALRFVWQRVTFGIHSTQRAESNQAGCKRHLKANATAVVLLEHLEEENDRMRSVAVINEMKLRFRHNNLKDNASYLVKALEPILSTYAFKLVLEQDRQARQYLSDKAPCTPDELQEEQAWGNDEDDFAPMEGNDADYATEHTSFVPEELRGGAGIPPVQLADGTVPEGQYVVRRAGGVHDISLQYDENDNGNIIFGACDEDYGMRETSTFRRATATWCSCQYPIAFGNLPCRHILHRCTIEGVARFDTSNIHPKYLKQDAAGVNQAMNALYSTPCVVRAPSTSTRQENEGLTKTERTALLAQQHQACLDLVGSSDTAFELYFNAMEKARVNLLQLKAPVPEVQGHATTNRQGNREGDGATTGATPSPANFEPREKDPPSKKTAAQVAAEKDLRQELGNFFTLGAVPDPFVLEKMLGQRVAVRWPAEGGKSRSTLLWYKGMVARVLLNSAG